MIKFENVTCINCHSKNLKEIGTYDVTTIFPGQPGRVIRHFYRCQECNKKNCVDEIHGKEGLTISLQD